MVALATASGVSQKSSATGDGRALWKNTDVLPAELEESLMWKLIITKIITFGFIHSFIQAFALGDSKND